jgi:hypothetical protein
VTLFWVILNLLIPPSYFDGVRKIQRCVKKVLLQEEMHNIDLSDT